MAELWFTETPERFSVELVDSAFELFVYFKSRVEVLTVPPKYRLSVCFAFKDERITEVPVLSFPCATYVNVKR